MRTSGAEASLAEPPTVADPRRRPSARARPSLSPWPWPRRSWWLAIALFLVASAPYLPALRGDFIWDDDAHVTANPTVIGPAGLREIWTTPAANYFPLVLTVFRGIYALWGLNPVAYHIVTLVCHALAAVLLWRVLRQLGIGAAWFATALWAVHPVQTESVAWISELKNTLSAVFYLTALGFWLRWLPAPDAATTGTKGPRRYYLLALASGLAALLSKPSTVMLPVILGLVTWWRLRSTTVVAKGSDLRTRASRLATIDRYGLALLPFAALSLLTGLWAIWEQKFHQHALGPEWNQTPLERLEIAGRALWFYLGKLAWPRPLLFVYPRWSLDTTTLAALLPLAAAVLLLVALAVRCHPIARATLFGFLYFVVSLFPVLGFFTVYYFRYAFVADHFQYLAAIGPLTLVAVLLTQSLQALPAGMAWLRASVPAGLLGGLALLTWQQAATYRDGSTLYTTLLARNPACWLAHNNLAQILTAEGRFDAAIEHCQASLTLQPTAVAHFNLGFALMQKGAIDEAVTEYHAALQLEPTMVEAYDNLGVLLASTGRTDDAVNAYRRALAIDPQSVTTQVNWGLLAAAQGDFAEAMEHYRGAISADPRSAEPHDDLGVALVQTHQYEQALTEFRRAAALAPASFSAQHHIGQMLAAEGKTAEAIDAYRTALRLRPASPDAHLHLGVALAHDHRTDEAAAEFSAVLQLKPDDAEAQRYLQALAVDARP